MEKAEAEAKHWKEEYSRVYADTATLRKSLEEDHRNALKYRAEGFIEDLVPALDAFYSALSAPAPSKEAENYRTGFTYIYGQIIAALEKEGFAAIEPKIGDHFDATFMHALEVEEAKTGGLVAKVHAKGYKLKDRLLRPVMVTATIEKTEPKEEKKEPVEEIHQA